MADLATLGLRVENGQAVQALRQFEQAVDDATAATERQRQQFSQWDHNLRAVAVSGALNTKEQAHLAQKIIEASGGMERYARILAEVQGAQGGTTAATGQLTDSTRRMTLLQMQATAMNEKMAATQRGVTDSTRRMTLAHMEAVGMNEKFDASQGKLNLTAGQGRLTLGRLGLTFASLASSAAGVHPVLGTLVQTLGSFAIGSLLMTGVLAGIAAFFLIMGKFSKETKEAREKMKELVRSMLELDKSQHPIRTATKNLADLRKELERVNDELAKGHRAIGFFAFLSALPETFKRLFTGKIDSVSDFFAAPFEIATERIKKFQKELQTSVAAASADLARLVRERNEELAAPMRIARQQQEVAVLHATHADQSRLVVDRKLEQLQIRQSAELARQELQHETINELTRLAVEHTGEELRVRQESIKAAAAINLETIGMNEQLELSNERWERFGRILLGIKDTASGLFTDFFTKGFRGIQDFAVRLRSMVAKFAADIIAKEITARVTGVLAGALGMALPTAAAAQQNVAATLMNTAADKQLAAAQIMSGQKPHTLEGVTVTASQTGPSALQRLGGGAAIGAAGFGIGWGIGQASGNRGIGAAGGAAGGALTGAALGSVIPGIGTAVGAVIGGLTGMAGGLLGAGKAAKEAARQLAELRQAVAASIESYRARVMGDDLAQRIAGAFDEIRGLLMQVDQAYRTSHNNAAQIFQRIQNGQSTLEQEIEYFRRTGQSNDGNRARADLLELFAENERRIREQFDRERREAGEDLEVRFLRGSGRDAEAERLAIELRQRREMEEAVRLGMDAAYQARLREVHALELTSESLAKLRGELNLVQGYRLQNTVFNALTPRDAPTSPTGPTDITPSTPYANAIQQQMLMAEQMQGWFSSVPSVPTPPPPATQPTVQASQQSTGDIHITVELDGTVVARKTLKVKQRAAQRKFGDTKRWAEIQSVD